MTRRGDVFENPVTGERAVVRIGTADTTGNRLVVDLYLRPGARVAAPHYHPAIWERFTVVSGRVGFALNGRRAVAEPGQTVSVPIGVVHDWWNAGDTPAVARVEIEPADRFEAPSSIRLASRRTARRTPAGCPLCCSWFCWRGSSMMPSGSLAPRDAFNGSCSRCWRPWRDGEATAGATRSI